MHDLFSGVLQVGTVAKKISCPGFCAASTRRIDRSANARGGETLMRLMNMLQPVARWHKTRRCDRHDFPATPVHTGAPQMRNQHAGRTLQPLDPKKTIAYFRWKVRSADDENFCRSVLLRSQRRKTFSQPIEIRPGSNNY